MTDPAPRYRAQYGEDRALDSIFGRPTGFCVEVGANDGLTGSNTWYFEQLGWRCLLVEADPELAQLCRERRPRSQVTQCAVVAPSQVGTVRFTIVKAARGVSSLSLDHRNLARLGIGSGKGEVEEVEVPARTLDSVLEEASPPAIDFMTIDVEGHEWDVLQGFDIIRWAPRFVIIERNRHFPDGRIMRYLREHGYAWRRSTGVNDWFEHTTLEATQSMPYRATLLAQFYLPKYLTPWRALTPELRAANRAWRAPVRSLLGSLGLLAWSRRIRGKSPS